MAARYAVANGNWSNVATWDGGTTLPQSGDTVRPNGFVVTIDQDVTVTELRNDASAPAAAGGSFTVASIPGGGRSITAAITNRHTTDLVNVTASSGTLTINGTITASNAGTNTSRQTIVLSGGGTLVVVVNGNVVAVGNNILGTSSAIQVSSTCTLTVNGNISGTNLGGANGTHCGIWQSAGNPTINVNGSIAPGIITSAGVAMGVYLNGGTPILNVVGNLLGCPAGGADAGNNCAIQCTGATATVTVTGDIVGPTGTATSPVFYQSTGTVTLTVNGAVSGSTGPGIRSTGTFTLTVSGTCAAGSGAAASGTSFPGAAIWISGSASSTVTLNGAVVAHANGPAFVAVNTVANQAARVHGPITQASNGMAAIHAYRWCVDNPPNQVVWTVRDDTGWPSVGNVVTLSNFSTNGMPDPADVREGVLYGPSDSLEGTAHSVLTADEVWGVLLADVDAVPGSIGALLRQAATVPAVGALLAAALHREG